jgi:hypothetical protein
MKTKFKKEHSKVENPLKATKLTPTQTEHDFEN